MNRLSVLLAVLATLAFAWGGPSCAGAPQVKTQPGFYRMMLGDFEVTALNDGVVAYPTAQVLPEATAAEIAAGLSAHGLHDPVGMSYNAFLINTGRKLVLIDTGTGGKLDDDPVFHGAGRLLANLRAAGYRPEQVDAVFITHRGQDHIGGLTLDGKRTFPNATVYAPSDEFDLFLDPAKLQARLDQVKDKDKPAARAWLTFTRDLFAPYVEAGRFQGFTGDQELAPGIRALATPGHTPGHTAYVVESRGQTLIVMGDLVLVGALQFDHPRLGSTFDADPRRGAEQRIRVLTQAASRRSWIAGGHLPFPGLGQVRAQDGHEGFTWLPVTYDIPQ